MPLVAAVQDFDFMGGSLGMAAAEAIIAGAEAARRARSGPTSLFAGSGGARMQEGILSLMQLPRTTIAIDMVKEAGLPYIVVLTNPTTGGVTASYAMLGDVHLAEPGALIGFAGPRVIEQTIREKLPEGFQRSEYLLEHGMVDMRRAPPPAARDRRPALPADAEAAAAEPSARATAPGAAAMARPATPSVASPTAEAPAHAAILIAMSELNSLLEALGALHPRQIDLSLDRIERLLDRLDRPQDRLPPVIHVAGTNGKGSTVAFLRAALEAAGYSVHAYTSPHLVRFNERIRLGRQGGGRLVDDADADRGDRGGAARQRRRADHLLRGDDGGRLPPLRHASGRFLPARGGARRPLRRDQRHRQAARRGDRLGQPRPRRVPRRRPRRHRGGEGRHPEARRARASSARRTSTRSP